jgi:hypothetical protein
MPGLAGNPPPRLHPLLQVHDVIELWNKALRYGTGGMTSQGSGPIALQRGRGYPQGRGPVTVLYEGGGGVAPNQTVARSAQTRFPYINKGSPLNSRREGANLCPTV